LSNAYFLAKFCFDTAENEPAKNLQKIANLPILLILLTLTALTLHGAPCDAAAEAVHEVATERREEDVHAEGGGRYGADGGVREPIGARLKIGEIMERSK